MEEKRRQLTLALGRLIKKLVDSVDGYIDENFCAFETIIENLELDEQNNGNKKLFVARLEEDYEYNLFNNLFDQSYLGSCYHYTSLNNLFQIFNSGKLHLNSLVGLNDKSELNRVNNFMGKGLDNPFHPITMMYHNSHFIFCLSENKDQLNQWRLYGQDACGVMIEFSIDHYHIPDRNILVSKVYYDLKIFEIIKNWQQECRQSLNTDFGFYLIDYWKFFFKHEDYKDENEIRLLIRNLGQKKYKELFKLNKYNIITPFIEIDCIGESSGFIKIKSIMLGPKFNEPDMNIEQLKYVLQQKYPGNDIEVLKSGINHYR